MLKGSMSHPMYVRNEAMRMHWQDNEQYMKTRCMYGTQRGIYVLCERKSDEWNSGI